MDGMALRVKDDITPLRPSPKRKRTDSTDISAASNSIFAPELAPSHSVPSSPPDSSYPVLYPGPASSPFFSQQSSYFTSQSEYPAPPHSSYPRPSRSPVHAPPLDILSLEGDVVAAHGADSPRSAVARKLEGLDLAVRPHKNPLPVLHFGTGKSAPAMKKPKLSFDDHDIDPAAQRAGSPSKAPKAKEPPEDAKILWWHDSEITGHLGLDSEDDGIGINGIGFKPTAAMAAARSVKRRRQVDEWRSRELREERRRRAEARRKAAPKDGGGMEGVQMNERRVVRFA